MMDRELLELAAKAYFGADGFEWNACSGFIEYIPEGSRFYSKWKPLADDGDALRLAVKLHLDVMTCCQQQGEIQVGGAVRSTTFQQVGDDPDAATRRAIVRTAAEIAKAE